MKNNSSRVSFNDRILTGEVWNLGLEKLKKVLDPRQEISESDAAKDCSGTDPEAERAHRSGRRTHRARAQDYWHANNG
jgi:hypothetical protein